MKKVLAFLCIACLSLVGFAADAVYNYENGVFTFNKDGDFNITYYSPESKYGQVYDFGYYFIKEDGNIERISLDTKLNGNETVTIKNLKAGDQVGLYFATKKNKDPYVYSQTELNSGKQVDQILFFQESQKGGDLFTFGDSKWESGDVVAFFGNYNAGQDLSGKPLPGVLTTLVIGGIAGYAMKRKSKKQTANK